MPGGNGMVDFEDEQRIRAAAALRIKDFDSWVAPVRDGDSFSEIPWLDIVTMASLALLAVDTHLKAADGIIDRLSRLYKWIVREEPQAKPAGVTLPERIIVLLADHLARTGSGLSASKLATETMTSVGDVEKELHRLEELSVARKKGNAWRLTSLST
jgi:hypothetical protein